MTVEDIKDKMVKKVEGMSSDQLVSAYNRLDKAINDGTASQEERVVFSFVFEEMETRSLLEYDEAIDDWKVVA